MALFHLSPGLRSLPTQYSTAGGRRYSCWGLRLLGSLLVATPALAQAVLPLQTLGIPTAALIQGMATLQQQAQGIVADTGVRVTLYRLDGQCQNFETEEIRVPEDRPISATVETLLKGQSLGALDLSGYRVQLSPDGRQLTLDLRLSPDSQRQLLSLSDCEQRALFGSLRQTLLNQPAWSIEQVQVTQRGTPLQF